MTDTKNKEETERLAREYFSRGDFPKAEFYFRRLTLDAPEDYEAYYNLGVTLAKLDRIEEALGCYRRAIELNPSFADAYTNFGVCLSDLNLIAHARQGFALAHQISPDNPIPILNEAISALALGDYAAGWQGFSERWRLPSYAKYKRDFPKPYWNGEDLSGKTLFLFAEQGFGDTIQMMRYVPLLAANGAKIIVESPPALTRLLRNGETTAQIISKGEAVPDFDFYCAMMDIPRALGTTVETIPAPSLYLYASEAEISACAEKFPRTEKRRIGLSWAGRASHENDRKRSLKFAQLQPLLALSDIEWVSLQRLVPERDLQELEASAVLDWGRNFSDFAATAAAIMTLDLVITVDTAIAHLAGALGKPVLILLPFYADWRWLTDREDSPWYPSARLFRQKRRKNWDGVIARVLGQLEAKP